MYNNYDLKPNHFRFRIGPSVVAAFGLNTVMPEDESQSQLIELLVDRRSPKEMEAYERVLTDAMMGDATLFAREDYVEEAWRIVDPVLKSDTPVHEYERKTWRDTDSFTDTLSLHGGCQPTRHASRGTLDSRCGVFWICKLQRTLETETLLRVCNPPFQDAYNPSVDHPFQSFQRGMFDILRDTEFARPRARGQLSGDMRRPSVGVGINRSLLKPRLEPGVFAFLESHRRQCRNQVRERKFPTKSSWPVIAVLIGGIPPPAGVFHRPGNTVVGSVRRAGYPKARCLKPREALLDVIRRHPPAVLAPFPTLTKHQWRFSWTHLAQRDLPQ